MSGAEHAGPPAGTGTLVDTSAAAVAAGVSPATVRSWARRGKIQRHGTDDKGRTLYGLREIYAAATSTTSNKRGREGYLR